MKSKLVIIGAGGHGKVCADVALKMNKWEEIVFLDNEKKNETVLGLKVVDGSFNWKDYLHDYDFFIAIGNNKVRENLHLELVQFKATIATLIHPTALLAVDVTIGVGCLLTGGVIVNPSSRIGKGVILNTGCTIDHDNQIGDFVHISPGVHLAGAVSIGNRSWIGIGSIVKNNVGICDDVIVGAGGVVVKNIKESGAYIGVPVKLR